MILPVITGWEMQPKKEAEKYRNYPSHAITSTLATVCTPIS